MFTWSAQSVNSICALLPLCHRWAFVRRRLHHDEASRPWKRFQNGGSLNGTTVFPPFAVYLRSFRTYLLVMLWVTIKNEQRSLIRYVSFLLRSVLKQRSFQNVLQRIIQSFSCCHFSWSFPGHFLSSRPRQSWERSIQRMENKQFSRWFTGKRVCISIKQKNLKSFVEVKIVEVDAYLFLHLQWRVILVPDLNFIFCSALSLYWNNWQLENT